MNIHTFDYNKPKSVSEVICINCKSRWICIRDKEQKLKQIKCNKCETTGFVIETGQNLEQL